MTTVQLSIYDFILPFGGHLKEDNRWVQLLNMIVWQVIDEEYSRHFFKTRVQSFLLWDLLMAR